MVNEVMLQPGYAREGPVNFVNKRNYSSRYIYNSNINLLDTEKAYKASVSLWKQWLNDIVTCTPVIPGRTFADVVKQNAYSCNTSAKKSVPLEVTQMHKLMGMPPESVKGENILCTVSPQVQVTRPQIYRNSYSGDECSH